MPLVHILRLRLIWDDASVLVIWITLPMDDQKHECWLAVQQGSTGGSVISDMLAQLPPCPLNWMDEAWKVIAVIIGDVVRRGTWWRGTWCAEQQVRGSNNTCAAIVRFLLYLFFCLLQCPSQRRIRFDCAGCWSVARAVHYGIVVLAPHCASAALRKDSWRLFFHVWESKPEAGRICLAGIARWGHHELAQVVQATPCILRFVSAIF